MTTTVVLDAGSGWVRAGLAEEDVPGVVFPSVVGRAGKAAAGSEVLVGDQAWARRGELTLSYPVRRGRVADWNDTVRLWRHAFAQLAVDPADCQVLLIDTPLHPRESREKTVRLLFDDLGVKGCFLDNSAVSALRASDRTTGVVVEVGEGVTHVVPVYEGYAVNHGVQRSEFAGRDVLDHLAGLLSQDGIALDTSTADGLETARTIMETLCYVARDPQSEAGKDTTEEFTLPDGTTVKLNTARYRAPESLFEPSPAGNTAPGLHELLHTSIQNTDIDVRKDLCQNIVLSGGTTKLPGLAERLRNEIQNLTTGVRVKIHAPYERASSAWISGSILATLDSSQHMWITREEYQQSGPEIVHSKCF
ncbi:actin, cytoplasmic 2 [Streptomyces vinaceus]|uniref:actin, cytoplasmic 2 n=1 Tax=Streptomyces vinaceus TaxID=1960 RepID=UPI003825D43F